MNIDGRFAGGIPGVTNLSRSSTDLERVLADARRMLVDTGSRNRLIHAPRGGKRTKSLPIIGATTDETFVALAREGATARFLPAPETATSRAMIVSRPPSDATGARRVLNLPTDIDGEALGKKLLTLYRDARTLEDEQGVNILYLALGFLRWREDDKSETVRESPLVLLPVALSRERERSSFTLRSRDDELIANQPLAERLGDDFGLILPEIPDGEEWSPSAYFDLVSAAVANKTAWSVDRERIELGFFSFAKHLMWRDLDPANWPDDGFLEHPLLRGLLRDGFEREPPLFPADANLDALFKPDDLVQVLDADASQTLVIETVRRGRDLVVQGPPGTGKSQTIANIIAAAAHDGKKVLFVAEKMAALSVVHDRLKSVGLEDICLQLHSRSANKGALARELARTLDAPGSSVTADALSSRFTRARDELNDATARLHTPIGDTGETPYAALAAQVALSAEGHPPPTTKLEGGGTISRDAFARVLDATRRLASVTTRAGSRDAHPFRGAHNDALQPMDLDRLAPEFDRFAGDAEAFSASAQPLADFLGVADADALQGLRRLHALVRDIARLPQADVALARCLVASGAVDQARSAALAGRDMRAAAANAEGLFSETAHTIDAAPVRAGLAVGEQSFFARWGGRYRDASTALAGALAGPLPRGARDRLALLDRLIARQWARARFLVHDEAMRAALGPLWLGEDGDFDHLQTIADWTRDILAVAPRPEAALQLAETGAAQHEQSLKQWIDHIASSVARLAGELALAPDEAFGCPTLDDCPLPVMAARARVWAKEGARYEEWARLRAADAALRALGGAELCDHLASGALPPDRAEAEMRYARVEALWKRATRETPALGLFEGSAHDEVVAEFRTIEKARRAAAAAVVRARHAAGMPRGATGAMAIVRGEIGRKSARMPIRRLMALAGVEIQKIKPVFLMSPISVAQFLAPGKLAFDLLVIDEASQVRPEDALGLIARATQICVVGDSRQLPPTSFFDRVLDDGGADQDDDDATEATPAAAPASDLESILTLCHARGLDDPMLRWHYRSRHPSLIEVSNAMFYDGKMVVPPSPSQARDAEGLIVRRVAGAYDRGGKRVNAIEAQAIVEAAARHARETPDVSLGVVAFSTSQRDLITDLLETSRRTDPTLDAFLREGRREDFFVKNLENVQGDERDVILISIGYGPRVAGNPLDNMNFGPVTQAGGDRRLNVLFTRARRRCEVFVSFSSSDIDLARSGGDGPRALKRFLHYAETGQIDEARPTGRDFESDFERAVAAEIRRLGYEVDAQVGSAGFRLDLAARDPARPGRWMLAIECDGATYHRALWARERDRLRQETLEGLGWRFHRIWSTDWFYRRASEIVRLRAALEDAASPREASRPEPSPPAAAPEPV